MFDLELTKSFGSKPRQMKNVRLEPVIREPVTRFCNRMAYSQFGGCFMNSQHRARQSLTRVTTGSLEDIGQMYISVGSRLDFRNVAHCRIVSSQNHNTLDFKD